MHIVIAIVLFLLALIFVRKTWPTLILLIGLVFVHSPPSKFFIIGADWQDWEWFLVAAALLVQIKILTGNKNKSKTAK